MTDTNYEEGPHDPKTCSDPTCKTVPEDAEWSGWSMAILNDGTISFHHMEENALYLLNHHNQEFKGLTDRYLDNPGNWVLAHGWLQNHPIFWRYEVGSTSKAYLECDIDAIETPSNVICDDGWRDVYMCVFEVDEDDENGPAGPRVMLEHGPHHLASTAKANGEHYISPNGMSSHDYELDVIESTYEAAVVSLAAKILVKYGVDAKRVND